MQENEERKQRVAKMLSELEERANQREAFLKRRKRRRIVIKLAVILSILILLAAGLTYASLVFFIPEYRYRNASKAIEEEEFDKAYETFIKLGNYKDSQGKALEARYLKGKYLMTEGEYLAAADIFEKLPGYQNSLYLANDCLDRAAYLEAKALVEAGKYDEAIRIFEKLNTFSDSSNQKLEAMYLSGQALLKQEKFEEAREVFLSIADYKDSGDMAKEAEYCRGLQLLNNRSYTEAITVFDWLGDYKESKDNLTEAKYGYILTHENNTNELTYAYLTELKENNYKDSEAIYTELYSWHMEVIINDSETDTKTSKTSFSKYDTVYAHFELTGGKPKEQLTLGVSYQWPGTEEQYYVFDYKLVNRSRDWFYTWYEVPAYGFAGTLIFRFYNDDDETLLGEYSVIITE